jgi:hypothetical protein
VQIAVDVLLKQYFLRKLWCMFLFSIISITVMCGFVVTTTAFVSMCDFVSHAVWESYRRKCQKYNPKYTTVCVCVCVYIHTHTHTYSSTYITVI